MARIRLHEIEPSRVEIIDLAGIYLYLECGFSKHLCSYPLYLDRTCKKKHLAICAISGVAYRGCTVNKEVKLTRPVIVWLLLPTRFFSWQRSSSHMREREGACCMYTLIGERQ
jgi:hypothetical protein